MLIVSRCRSRLSVLIWVETARSVAFLDIREFCNCRSVASASAALTIAELPNMEKKADDHEYSGRKFEVERVTKAGLGIRRAGLPFLKYHLTTSSVS